MITDIKVRSRKDMRNEAYIISVPSVIISICDIDKTNINFPVNWDIVGILNLQFEDWDDPKDKTTISEEDAAKIAAFVNKFNDKEQPFVLYVNCEAGVSRSAGVAAAIAKFLFNDDEQFFRTKLPNMLCYRRVLNALNGMAETIPSSRLCN